MLEIKGLRNKIDKIDTMIIKKLSQRQVLSAKIGQLKKKSGKRIKDLAREKQLDRLHVRLSKQYHLDRTFTKKLFKMIILYSRQIQK